MSRPKTTSKLTAEVSTTFLKTYYEAVPPPITGTLKTQSTTNSATQTSPSLLNKAILNVNVTQQTESNHDSDECTCTKHLTFSIFSSLEGDCCLLASGDVVYIWGSVFSDFIFTPRVMSSLTQQTVVQVSCGASHAVILTDLGHVFVWGRNEDYQLGTGQTIDVIHPTLLSKISHVFISKIACGSSYTLALTDSGNVVFWGTLRYGQNLGRVKLPTPHYLRNLTRYYIVDIASGGAHCLALTRDGKVFSWGNPIYGRLGRSSSIDTATDPRIPCLVPTEYIIKAICCGEQHNLAITSQGYVLGWGQNEFKQAVPPFRRIQESVIYSPTLISPELFAKHSIVQLAAGRQYSMALSENNQLFFWGCWDKPHIGLTKSETKFREIAFDRLSISNIDCIVGGLQHCLILSDKNQVFSVGKGQYGQLGREGVIDSETPVSVSGISLPISTIAAGGNISIAATGMRRSLLGEALLKAFNNSQFFPDVTVTLMNGTKLLAHKCILSARSPVLREEILKQESMKALQQGQSIDHSIELLIETNNVDVASSFLKFLYTGTYNRSLNVSRSNMLQLAKKYEINDLVCLLEPTTRHSGYKNLLSKDFSSLLYYVIDNETQEYESSDNHKETNQKNNQKDETKLPGDNPSTKMEKKENNDSISFSNSVKCQGGLGGRFADINFCVEGKLIPAHKVILCATSEYFKIMFTGGMKESREKVITIPETTFPAFVALIQYLYTGQLDVDVNLALDVLPLSSQYNLERLMQKCESLIRKEVDQESVIYVFQVANFYGATRLQQFCLDMIVDYYSHLKETDDWKRLTPDEQKLIESAVQKNTPYMFQ